MNTTTQSDTTRRRCYGMRYQRDTDGRAIGRDLFSFAGTAERRRWVDSCPAGEDRFEWLSRLLPRRAIATATRYEDVAS